MEIDPPQSQTQSMKQKAEALHGFATGPLSSSIAKLSGSSRGIPSDKDFHFYYNFNEFKLPINEIANDSQLMLGTIGSSAHLWGKDMGFPEDLDDAYDWLVNVNDEVFERFDMSADEFQRLRKKEEESGVRVMSSVDSESGFQLVSRKKKNGVERDGGEDSSPSSVVKVASRDKKTMGTKPKVPFHIPTIPRPQDVFKIVVNNSNQPFQHVWLPRSEDGSRFIHPQEKFSYLDFVDRNFGDVEPVKPPPTESTLFKLVEEVKDLKELAAKLRGVNEFAVDLEHNQYRSFQGLTCLMQISTRTEDFVVDTLKLRVHIGPHLREVFKDPMKKKVMHGADRDIVWLQRDFGIYVCNLFDTGQASRVLKLERNSLEFLLYHFCGVTANKEYQNADWRLRPLPHEMLRYAREDTHYLLHIYDLMRIRLLSLSAESGNSDDLLLEVYKRSYDICMQLYEKELLTDNSYFYIYGLHGTDLNAQQLAIVAGLCEWRDVVARADDESTGFVLPNKTLLEIAKQMPVTTGNLRRLVKSKHPYVERNIGSVVSIIRHSMQNATAFEAAAEQIKMERLEKASEANKVSSDGNEALPPEASARLKVATATQSIFSGITTSDSMSGQTAAPMHSEESSGLGSSIKICRDTKLGALGYTGQSDHMKNQTDKNTKGTIISGQFKESNKNLFASQSGSVATVQVLKNPSRAFGAMLGNSASKRKFDPDKKEKEQIKLEQIKSAVNLPFPSFLGRAEQSQPHGKEPAKVVLETKDGEEPPSVQPASCIVKGVILLDIDSDDDKSASGEAPNEQDSEDFEEPTPVQAANFSTKDVILLESDSDDDKSATDEAPNEQLREDGTLISAPEVDHGNDTMSLSDLSSSFHKCYQSINETRNPKQAEKSKESDGFVQLKPFDYEAARKQVRFGEDRNADLGLEGDGSNSSRLHKVDRKKSSVVGMSHRDERSGDFAQGRRRQAFPASGNRSATFR